MLLLAVCCGTWAQETYNGTGTFKKCTGTLQTGLYVIGNAQTTNEVTKVYAINNTTGTSWILYTEVTLEGDDAVNPDASIVWKYDESTGYIQNIANNNYIYWSSGNNVGCCGTTAYAHTVSETSTSGVYNVKSKATTSRVLRRNSTSGYRYYASSTGTADICFYKLDTGGSQTETCETPTFSPVAGTYTEAQSVSISTATDGATIYYTTDGSAPTTSSNVYSTPINVASTMTINAIAVKEGYDNSEMATATYTIESQSSESSDGTWELTDLADLTSTDVFVIVGYNGSNYAMSNNNGTGSAPSAVTVTVADNKITSEVTDAIKWNVSGDATNGYTFYPNGSTTKWLYCTNSNNGVRVGDGDAKHFTLTTGENAGYLTTTETNDQRYLGIYNSQDWRCYNSINSNITGQSFAFYKYVAADDNRQEAGLAWSASTVDVNIFAEENDYTLPTLTNPNNVTVSYSSTNEDVAVIDAESGEILLETGAVGSAVIKATFAGDDSYKPAEVSYTINIVDNREVPTFAWSESTVEIDLGATEYTLPTLTKPEGATVTYSSSDDEVALVDENTGEVVVETSVVGTATITATFAGNDTYKPATALYTINIIDPNAADGSEARPYTVADIIAGVTNTSDVYVKGFIVGSYNNGNKNNFAREGQTDTNLALADDPAETNVNNTIAVQLPSGTIRTALNTKDKPYNIGVAQIIVKGNIEKYITDMGIKSVSDFAKVAEQVSISAAGMSTYYTDCALDFTGNDNIYAYTVTDGTNKVTYNKVDVVPANTAVVLRSVNEGAASELIPVSESTATASSALTGTLEDIYVTTGYVLNNGSNGVGFYKANPEANDGQGTKIAAHRAYLPATSGAKDFIGVDFESVATAISAIETETETNNVYDLQGRKVMNPAKGLYIVNGKKVVIK